MSSFQNILKDSNVVKVGMEIQSFELLLLRQHGLMVEQGIELLKLAQISRFVPDSLKKMAHSKDILSNWQAPQLTPQQGNYAAKNAHTAIEILKDLISRNEKIMNHLTFLVLSGQ